jgi:hypothetical protein
MKRGKRTLVKPQAYLAGAASGNFGNLFSVVSLIQELHGCS